MIQTFLECVLLTSLIITGIHVAFQDGNILMWPRIWIANVLDKYLGKKWSRIIQKPLWDCLPCMASVWTIALSQQFDIGMILAVSGFNVVIERIIHVDDEPADPVDPLGPQINNHFK